MFDKFIKIVPFILVFLVALETVAAIMSTTLTSAVFHAFAACCANGFVLYYYQTRNRS